jgi:hypothetical protein
MVEDDSIQFSLTFALDRDEFFRRSCPNCGGDFKTKVDPGDMSFLLQPAFRRIESEIGGITLSTSNGDQTPHYLSCPYCNYRAKSGDMLTEEFQGYLKRFVIREYVLPKINSMFSDFSDSLKRNSRSGGFFRIEFKADFDSSLPSRPISGPEPPDMMKIELLCCGETIKVRDGYFDLDKCPHCGEDVKLV